MRVVLAFVAAVVTTYILAVVSYGQLNLANLVEMGLSVDAATRFYTASNDLFGMMQIYLPVISVALLLGFLIARLIIKWVPQLRTLAYVSAGFAGIFAAEAVLTTVIGSGIHPLAVTRTTVGLLSQCVAGAIGGLVFVSMLPTKTGDNASRSAWEGVFSKR